MYTAQMARDKTTDALDRKIKEAVDDAARHGNNTASLRVYFDDSFVHCIKEELEKRGFHSVEVPDICLRGDVYFSW